MHHWCGLCSLSLHSIRVESECLSVSVMYITHNCVIFIAQHHTGEIVLQCLGTLNSENAWGTCRKVHLDFSIKQEVVKCKEEDQGNSAIGQKSSPHVHQIFFSYWLLRSVSMNSVPAAAFIHLIFTLNRALLYIQSG